MESESAKSCCAVESPAPASHGSEQKQTFVPLIVVFAYIVGAVALQILASGHFDLRASMTVFMAMFFILFSMFKMMDLRAFADAYSSYDVIAKHFYPWGLIYPFVELAMGVSYLTQIAPPLTNLITFIVMGISSLGVAKSLWRKEEIRCACLGTAFKLPLSKISLFENVVMMLMSAVMFPMH